MKLLKIESDAKGIWYFTSVQDCADFLDVTYQAIHYWLRGVNKTCKGFTSVEWIEDDSIITRFINPSRQTYIERYGEDKSKKRK